MLVSEGARGVSQSSVTLDNVDLMVADNVIVGELDLGGTNPQNSAQGTLRMIDSQLETGDLRIAQRMNTTLGTLSGRMEMTRSLAKVSGTLSLNPAATIVMEIAGDRRRRLAIDAPGGFVDALERSIP